MASDWLNGIGARIRALLRRRRDAEDLDAELGFHLEQLTTVYEGRGLSPNEARRKARIDLGTREATQEQCRDASGLNWFEDLRLDTLIALRALRKSPGFAVAAIFTLALGIGLNTALFTVLYSVVFRPLPVPNAGSLWNLYMDLSRSDNETRSSYGSRYFESFAEFSWLQENSRTAELAGAAEADLSLRVVPVRSVHAQLVSANLFSLLGARPALGRFFLPAETAKPGGDRVAVLSYGAWTNQFGGDPNIAGRSITMNRTAFTIVGVAEQHFRGPFVRVPDVWIPITMQALTRPGESLVDDTNAAFVQVFGRNRAAFDDTSVRAEMALLGQQSVAAHGSRMKARMQVVPAAFLNYPDVMSVAIPVLGVVWLIGGLVLLVACANVANLLLARGLSRRREIAIRLSIGAGRFRLIRQMLTESMMLGLAGGLAGVVLAWQAGVAGLRLVPASLGELQFDVAPDPLVLGFAVLVSLLAALTSGVLPAFHALHVDLTPSLKSEGLHAAGRGRGSWLQNTLVGVQVGVSVILLVAAGLMTRGFLRATNLDTGREAHGLLIASFDLRQQQYTPERAELFHGRLSARLAGTPGITASSVSLTEPDLSSNGSSVWAPGTDGSRSPSVRVAFDEVGPDYFRAAGIRLLAGRAISPAEFESGAKVVVIDEQLSKALFDGRPLGRYLSLDPVHETLYQVIGVAANTTNLMPGRRNNPWYYAPLHGLRFMEARLWVRYRGTAHQATQALRAAVKQDDPELTVTVHTAEEDMKTALMPIRIASWAAAALGSLALLVAAIGLYGVISFAVTRRLREMGVRMALGARRGDVLRLVFGQMARPLGLGSVVGLAAAIGLGFLLRSILYGVSPLDPWALVSVLAVLTLTGLLASWIPARRATRVDPASVLRND